MCISDRDRRRVTEIGEAIFKQLKYHSDFAYWGPTRVKYYPVRENGEIYGSAWFDIQTEKYPMNYSVRVVYIPDSYRVEIIALDDNNTVIESIDHVFAMGLGKTIEKLIC